MEFSIYMLTFAFVGGAFGALIGALPNFILCGFVALAGIVATMAGATFDFNGAIVWGAFLGPQVGFAGGAAATIYAKKIGVLGSGKDIGASLAGLKRPDVFLVAGVFGVLGYVVGVGLGMLLPGKLNPVAMSIVIVALLSKAIFDTPNILGKVPEEVARVGGRFSARCEQVWVEVCRTPAELTVTGLVVGGLSAAATGLMLQDPATAPVATVLGFSISTISIMFVMMGVNLPITHHIALTAAVVASFTGGDLVWGMAFGVLAAFAAHYLAQTFLVFGDTWVDPPSMAIALLSIFTFWVFPDLGLYATGPAIPLVVLAVALVWSAISFSRSRTLTPESVEIAA